MASRISDITDPMASSIYRNIDGINGLYLANYSRDKARKTIGFFSSLWISDAMKNDDEIPLNLDAYVMDERHPSSTVSAILLFKLT